LNRRVVRPVHFAVEIGVAHDEFARRVNAITVPVSSQVI
jgi:hypothetical protein